ncbi:MAG: hypothetical protein ACLU4N_28545 [Butyricimonas faecihominis]
MTEGGLSGIQSAETGGRNRRLIWWTSIAARCRCCCRLVVRAGAGAQGRKCTDHG